MLHHLTHFVPCWYYMHAVSNHPAHKMLYNLKIFELVRSHPTVTASKHFRFISCFIRMSASSYFKSSLSFSQSPLSPPRTLFVPVYISINCFIILFFIIHNHLAEKPHKFLISLSFSLEYRAYLPFKKSVNLWLAAWIVRSFHSSFGSIKFWFLCVRVCTIVTILLDNLFLILVLIIWVAFSFQPKVVLYVPYDI